MDLVETYHKPPCRVVVASMKGQHRIFKKGYIVVRFILSEVMLTFFASREGIL